MLDKIQVRRREFFERMAEIAHHGHGLQKDFRKQHRRADIEVNATAIQSLHNRAEETEIVKGRFPNGFPRSRGMRVNGIRSYGDVNCYRDVSVPRFSEDAAIRIRKSLPALRNRPTNAWNAASEL